MRRVTEQRLLPTLGSGGITCLNVGWRSPCLACSHEPSSLLWFCFRGFLAAREETCRGGL